MTNEQKEQVDILLVDDRAENMLALEAILEPLGQNLVRARSGEEALRSLLDREFAVILLDVQMPGLNGFETAQLIKARERTRYIPIIFLTAIDREAHQSYRGYAAGAVDFLAKPFDPWVLRAKVEVFVGMQQERRRLLDRITDLERRLDAVSGERLAQALERVERLLVMSGDEGSPDGPAVEALAELRKLREDLLTPFTTPSQPR